MKWVESMKQIAFYLHRVKFWQIKNILGPTENDSSVIIDS